MHSASSGSSLPVVRTHSQSAVVPASQRSNSDFARNCRSLPCSPNVSGRSVFRDGSPNAQQAAALDQFLGRIEAFKKGSLQELTTLLQEAATFQTKALQATTAPVERDAVQKVEACYERAGRVALTASQQLQELTAEATTAHAQGGSAADLRRQSLAGTSAMLQDAVRNLFQAQGAFRSELQAKSQRQLRLAFPGASEEQMAAVASASRSAASTIQDTMSRQSGSGPLETRTALMVGLDELEALEELADSARMLKQALTEVELLVVQQGETISDIALQVARTRDNTVAGHEQLRQATLAQNRMRKRQVICCLCMLLVLAIFIVIYFLVIKS